MTEPHKHAPDQWERELTTDLKDTTPDRPKGLPLHTRIVIGLIAGGGLGLLANALLGAQHGGLQWVVLHITEPIGTLFLRLLLMIVVPLIFAALIVGVAGIGDPRRLGRVGLKTLAFTLVFSAISASIGLVLANVIRPWDRIAPETAQALQERYGSEAEQRMATPARAAVPTSPVMEVINTLVPSNPVASVASSSPNLLHLIFFAAILGIAATLLPESASAPFLKFMQSLFDVSAKLVDLIMKTAPYAVAALLFTTTARFGLDLLAVLAWFVVTVLLGLALHFFGVFSAAVYVLARIPPLEFFRRSKTAILTAFSTSSSNATLPTSLRVAEENLGIPRQISGFVLTVGATINMNGTTLYEGLTVLFLAHLGGVELGVGMQIALVYMAVMGAIGAAGVPGGSIPLIIGILVQLGINPGLIAIILGVDRILDMARTAVNVTGDLVASSYVARSEGFPLLNNQAGAEAAGD